jgi:hypothetical protein
MLKALSELIFPVVIFQEPLRYILGQVLGQASFEPGDRCIRVQIIQALTPRRGGAYKGVQDVYVDFVTVIRGLALCQVEMSKK